MSRVRRALARMLAFARRNHLDDEFDEEARVHVALATDDYVRCGQPLAEAQRLARLRFGVVAASRDAHRDSRSLPWLDEVVFDLRLSLRGLRRDRWFTVAAITMLALAIGLNLTVFTIMDAMVFRGFPLVSGNNRLVYLQERGPGNACCISYADFEDWRAGAQAFEGMAFIGSNGPITFRDSGGRSSDLATMRVSANVFRLIGVRPMLGRDFLPADEADGAEQVLILNYRFWESRFGKRPDIIGVTVQVNGAPATVIGVMPQGFDFPYRENLWMPVMHTPALQTRGFTPDGFTVVARLRDGVTLEQARTELETINRRLAVDYPGTNRNLVPTVATHSQMTGGSDSRLIWGSLWAGAWLVWLIACANVANLTLVRTLGRWRDFATRAALGAGHRRMMRQVFVECLMLAGAAGAIGWGIAAWSLPQWAAATVSPYQVLDYRLNGGSLGYLAALSLAAAVLVSLAPATRLFQLGASGAMRGDARGVTQGLRCKHLAGALVAVQVALAVVLLSGAGVLTRSLLNIVTADAGVQNPESMLVGAARLPSDNYPTLASRLAFYERLDARLVAIPGVETAALASAIPVRWAPLRALEIEGRSRVLEGEDAVALLTAGTNYFSVLGATAISGRVFDDNDRRDSLPVALVNQRFAEVYWPGEPPVGKHLRVVNRDSAGEWRTVVGVVPNILQGDPLRQQFKPLVYTPFRQEPASRLTFFLLRTVGPRDDVAQAVRLAVQQLAPDVTLEDVETLAASFAFKRDLMDADHSELGKYAAVAPVFATIALLLATVGLYAMVAHSMSQRTREIGIRVAIGAAMADVRRMVLREGMQPVGIGVAGGLAASLAVNRLLQSQLVGLSPYDPATLATAPFALIVVAWAACYVPARRAVRVDPVVALRSE